MFGYFSNSISLGERPAALTQVEIAAKANVWYDAASPSYFQPTNPTNNTQLTQWIDRSAAAHNAGPTGGTNKPVYMTPSLNGYGTVSFNGISQNLQITNTTWAASKSAVTMFVVAKKVGTGIQNITSSDTGGYAIKFNGTNYEVTAGGGTGTSTVTGDTTNYHLFTVRFDGSQTSNANRLQFRYNKMPQTLNFGATTVGTTTNSATSKINFGWDGTGNHLNGSIAEVMFFTTNLGATQISLIEGYLGNKWGV